MDKISGIYQIKNITNNRRYVGSSNDVYHRFGQHKTALQNRKHFNSHLQHAWDKYGEDNFVFQFLLLCSEKDLLKYEQAYLERGHCEYNLSGIAGRAEMTLETRAKLSASAKAASNSGRFVAGCERSVKARAKISAGGMGNTNALGCKRSTEVRARMSARMMGNQIHLGHKHTDEAKAKMRVARIEYCKNKLKEGVDNEIYTNG